MNSFKSEAKKLISDLALDYDKINLNLISDEFKEKIKSSKIFNIDNTRKRWIKIENTAFYINDGEAWNYIAELKNKKPDEMRSEINASQEFLNSLTLERPLTYK